MHTRVCYTCRSRLRGRDLRLHECEACNSRSLGGLTAQMRSFKKRDMQTTAHLEWHVVELAEVELRAIVHSVGAVTRRCEISAASCVGDIVVVSDLADTNALQGVVLNPTHSCLLLPRVDNVGGPCCTGCTCGADW